MICVSKRDPDGEFIDDSIMISNSQHLYAPVTPMWLAPSIDLLTRNYGIVLLIYREYKIDLL